MTITTYTFDAYGRRVKTVERIHTPYWYLTTGYYTDFYGLWRARMLWAQGVSNG